MREKAIPDPLSITVRCAFFTITSGLSGALLFRGKRRVLFLQAPREFVVWATSLAFPTFIIIHVTHLTVSPTYRSARNLRSLTINGSKQLWLQRRPSDPVLPNDHTGVAVKSRPSHIPP